jgi:hypothetical protein
MENSKLAEELESQLEDRRKYLIERGSSVGYRPELATWTDEELGDVPGYRCWLYFVQCQTTKRVKIGISSDPVDRMKQMQQGCPTQLVILHKIKTRSGLEEILHAQFTKHRLHGEWFEFTDEIREYVEKRKAEEREKPVNHKSVQVCPHCKRPY